MTAPIPVRGLPAGAGVERRATRGLRYDAPPWPPPGTPDPHAPELDRVLRHTGLTKSQFGVLQALTHLEKASSAALARTVFVTPQAMVGIIAGLERKGFIKRKASAASARVIEATVTPAGRAAYDAAVEQISQVDSVIARAFSKAELTEMSSYLQRLITVLQEHDPGP
jgi:DNA-binding MarR family transcriptional regulator